MNEAYTSATQRIGPERIEKDEVEQPADCALVQDLLPLYIDNEVSPESHDRIATHIAQCERCAGYLAGARSVRAQLMGDQRAVRAPAPAVPTATHAPIGSAGTRVQKFITNTSASPIGRWLLIGAAIIGGLMIVPVFGPLAIAAAIPVGLFVIGREIWRSLRGQSSGALSLPTGAASAILAAIVSITGVLVCTGLIFSSLIIFVESGELAAYLVGILMLIFGSTGLVMINQRRGWLPQYASPPVVQQLFKFIVLGGGIAAGIILVSSVEGISQLFGFVVVGSAFFWLFSERSAKP